MKTEEVQQRIEKEAKNKFPIMVDEPGVINVERRNGYIEGATAEYLRAQDELAAYKLKVEEARKLTFEKLMEIGENQKAQQEIIDAKDELLSEMAEALNRSLIPIFVPDEVRERVQKVKDLLQKYSKSKEA